VSPALSWNDAPTGTHSFALVVHDPDAPDPAAPEREWAHWIIYNIPVDCKSLAEGVKELPHGAHFGKNDWGSTGWRGPNPPKGRHRYFFELHALNRMLPTDLGAPTMYELNGAMKGHVLGTASIMGTYAKTKQ